MAANFWEEKFGEQILLDEYLWSKMGNKYILKEFSLEAILGSQHIFGGIFASKMSFGGRKKYWVTKIVWRGKIWGANSFG